MELVNVQSVGTRIENMCLATTDMGLEGLWICNVFQVYHTLVKWLGTDSQLVTCAEETPPAHPRMPMEEVL